MLDGRIFLNYKSSIIDTFHSNHTFHRLRDEDSDEVPSELIYYLRLNRNDNKNQVADRIFFGPICRVRISTFRNSLVWSLKLCLVLLSLGLVRIPWVVHYFISLFKLCHHWLIIGMNVVVNQKLLAIKRKVNRKDVDWRWRCHQSDGFFCTNMMRHIRS